MSYGLIVRLAHGMISRPLRVTGHMCLKHMVHASPRTTCEENSTHTRMAAIWTVSVLHLMRHRGPFTKTKSRDGTCRTKDLVHQALKVFPDGPPVAHEKWKTASDVPLSEVVEFIKSLTKRKIPVPLLTRCVGSRKTSCFLGELDTFYFLETELILVLPYLA